MKIIHDKPMEAHLWQKPSTGIYFAVWQDLVTGKQRQKSLKTKDKTEALRQLNHHNRDLAAGKVKPIAPRITSHMSDFRLRFLEYVEDQIRVDEMRPDTMACYKAALDKAVEAWGADRNLLRIREEDIIFYQNFISKKGLVKSSVNKNFRHLKTALRKGKKWGVVNEDLGFPSQWKESKTIRYFSEAELKTLFKLIKKADKDFADFCRLSVYSGMRSGEIIRLNAKDIDNPPGFLRISVEQKNREENRIPISKRMRKILDRHQQDIGPLFIRFRKNYQVSALFKKFTTAAGLPDHRFHDLRHTFGAHMVIHGVDIRTIQQLMRHRSIESTMVYTRLFPEALVPASNVLNFGIG